MKHTMLTKFKPKTERSRKERAKLAWESFNKARKTLGEPPLPKPKRW